MGEGAVSSSIAADEDDATRAAILTAARAIAERDGVEKLTLGQVAVEANIPRTSVYRLFTRKEDLLMSIAADDLTSLAHDMRGVDWPEGGDTPESAVVIPVAKPRDGTVEAIVAAVALPTTRQPDAWLERRLRVFEKALAAMEAKQEELERNTRQTVGSVEMNIKTFADKIHAIDERVDETASRHKATASELRQVLSENMLRIETVEHVARAALAEPSEPAAGPEVPTEFSRPAEEPERHVEDIETLEPADVTPAAPAFVERRRPENQGAVSFIVERRKSMQEAQAIADAARAAAEPEKKARQQARHQRYWIAGVCIAAIFAVAAGLAFSKGVADGRALRGTVKPALMAMTAPHVVHASQLTPLDRLTAAAETGDAKAELIVGTKYLNGEGTAKDPAAAVHWLERSAIHGQPVAQYLLGTLYQQGDGTPSDMTKAIQWYEAAALQGNRKAMHDLAIAYAEGSGSPKNPQEAARWFSRAASLGYVDSQFDLAVLYERGDGVPQSLLDAYKWYAIASTQGDSESGDRIEALRTQMNADDLAVAENAAKAFRPLPLNAAANITPTE